MAYLQQLLPTLILNSSGLHTLKMTVLRRLLFCLFYLFWQLGSSTPSDLSAILTFTKLT